VGDPLARLEGRREESCGPSGEKRLPDPLLFEIIGYGYTGRSAMAVPGRSNPRTLSPFGGYGIEGSSSRPIFFWSIRPSFRGNWTCLERSGGWQEPQTDEGCLSPEPETHGTERLAAEKTPGTFSFASQCKN
jgi:hypothetical protein